MSDQTVTWRVELDGPFKKFFACVGMIFTLGAGLGVLAVLGLVLAIVGALASIDDTLRGFRRGFRRGFSRKFDRRL